MQKTVVRIVVRCECEERRCGKCGLLISDEKEIYPYCAAFGKTMIQTPNGYYERLHECIISEMAFDKLLDENINRETKE